MKSLLNRQKNNKSTNTNKDNSNTSSEREAKTKGSLELPAAQGSSVSFTKLNDNESNTSKDILEIEMINKILPKELLIRVFSYLDVVSLCRCAQVSKVKFRKFLRDFQNTFLNTTG